MRKFFTYIFMVFCIQASAQSYPITAINISLPSNPDANIANWGNGVSQLSISANARAINGRVDGFVQESKILVIIKKGGGKACGNYTSTSAPPSNFNSPVKVWSGNNASALLGQNCTLLPGDYELSVQFFGYSNGKMVAFSEEKTKVFSIRAKEQLSYQVPQPVMPINNAQFLEVDIAKPIAFRWTPLVPRPQEPTTYRLRVWQLMQGQTETQARTTNRPIFTKDIDNLTQTIVSGLLTGPCKPPYLCDFVWNVQALNREGKPIGENNSTSETFSFSYAGSTIVTNGMAPKLISPMNKSTVFGEGIRFAWSSGKIQSDASGAYKIKIVEIKGDESPENAIRTNKPFFEKDSINAFRGNKPIFEKDSLPYFIYPSSAPKFKVDKTYVWTVQVINRDGKPISGNNSTSEVFIFAVGNSSTAIGKLINLSPLNRSTLTGELPLFSWTSTVSSENGGYKIKIVEIKGDESPENAIIRNKPIFEKDSLNEFKGNKPIFEKDSTLFFQYPSTGPKFKIGQKYTWTVSIFDRWGNLKMSSPTVFTIKPRK